MRYRYHHPLKHFLILFFWLLNLNLIILSQHFISSQNFNLNSHFTLRIFKQVDQLHLLLQIFTSSFISKT